MSQSSLFESEDASSLRRPLDLPDAQFDYYEHAFSRTESERLFSIFHQHTPWRHDEILIHGKRIPLPRLQAWYADGEIPLRYSGMAIASLPITPSIDEVRSRVRELTGHEFNGVLLTLYRDGKDSVGWHSDDEAEFGTDPVIGSVSFGETRDFVLKHRFSSELTPVKCALTNGSLLLMGSGSQTHWSHALPKRKRISRPRINLTLRSVLCSD